MNSTPILSTQVNIDVQNSTLMKLYLFAVVVTITVVFITKAFK